MKTGLSNRKGQVLVLVALMLSVILCLGSLALDLGRAYGVRARLNAAADAASYEAARSLGQGATADQAKEIGHIFFDANYPAEYLGAKRTGLDVLPVRGTDGSWTVQVSATAQMPAFLAGLAGRDGFNISTYSEAERATLDMVLVIDTSWSMINVFPQVKASAKEFIHHFRPVDDRLGLVTFADGAFPVVSICGAFPNSQQDPTPGLPCGHGFSLVNLDAAVNGLTCGPNGRTVSEEAIKKAMAQLNSIQILDRSKIRVIVFVSDGAPNTFNGKFGSAEGNLYSDIWDNPGNHELYDPKKVWDGGPDMSATKTLPATDANGDISVASYNNKRPLPSLPHTFDPWDFSCAANKAARNMAENVANMARSQGIMVFSLGLGSKLDGPEYGEYGYTSCSTNNETGTQILNRIANTRESDSYNPNQPAGIYCKAETPEDLGPCFEKIASAILRITK